MKKFSYVLTKDGVLQSRSMNQISKEAARFKSHIMLSDGIVHMPIQEVPETTVLDMKRGKRFFISAEGMDEEAAIAAMQNYFVAYL